MPKRNYVPTEADALTGAAIRDLRQRRGETLKQTVDRSNFGKDASTLAATERGERRLTELEATALAAHFGTTADRIIVQLWPQQPATEQEWLGNPPTELFAVDKLTDSELAELNKPTPNFDERFAAAEGNIIAISRDNPLSPAQYRDQVWIPYLENRYAADLRQTG